ncbi:hypothetical protein ACFL57_00845 [Candidatus Margulisiibacteriota bacterium]
MCIKGKRNLIKLLQVMLVLICWLIFSMVCIAADGGPVEAVPELPLPEEIPGLIIPMVESTSEHGSFSAVPVDPNTISIMHITKTGSWDGVPVEIPERITMYKLFAYRNMLFLTGGFKGEVAVLNKKIYKIDVFDGIDEFTWQEIGEAPAMAENINMRFSTANITLDLFIDNKYLKEYRAEVDKDFNILNWQ